MTENINTRTYGIVTLSTAKDTEHLCWRTLAGGRVGPFHATLSSALAYGQYLARNK